MATSKQKSPLYPQCGGFEFELLESHMGAKSVIVKSCAACGWVEGANLDHNPGGDIVSKLEACMGLEKGSFKTVSSKHFDEDLESLCPNIPLSTLEPCD